MHENEEKINCQKSWIKRRRIGIECWSFQMKTVKAPRYLYLLWKRQCSSCFMVGGCTLLNLWLNEMLGSYSGQAISASMPFIEMHKRWAGDFILQYLHNQWRVARNGLNTANTSKKKSQSSFYRTNSVPLRAHFWHKTTRATAAAIY